MRVEYVGQFVNAAESDLGTLRARVLAFKCANFIRSDRAYRNRKHIQHCANRANGISHICEFNFKR